MAHAGTRPWYHEELMISHQGLVHAILNSLKHRMYSLLIALLQLLDSTLFEKEVQFWYRAASQVKYELIHIIDVYNIRLSSSISNLRFNFF